MGPNVFSTLARYSAHAEENYLTESLVYVARLLLERDRPLGLDLVNLLACQRGEPWFTSTAPVQISTQVNTAAGTPDIELRQGGVLVYVEVKHDSPLGIDQLERYKDQLDQASVSRRRLVLLSRSRYSKTGTTLDPSAYHRLYWHNIYSWLADAVTDDEVNRYFCDSLMALLEEQNMSVKKVGWEYINGVSAMREPIQIDNPTSLWRHTGDGGALGAPPRFVVISSRRSIGLGRVESQTREGEDVADVGDRHTVDCLRHRDALSQSTTEVIEVLAS